MLQGSTVYSQIPMFQAFTLPEFHVPRLYIVTTLCFKTLYLQGLLFQGYVLSEPLVQRLYTPRAHFLQDSICQDPVF